MMHIIKLPKRTPAEWMDRLKGVKVNTIARLHGRRMVSAYQLRQILKLNPHGKIKYCTDALEIIITERGMTSTATLKYLQAERLRDLEGFRVASPERPAPFVKHLYQYGN